MRLWLQHLLVLLLVAACVAYAVWGAVRTLIGKRSHLGSCCAKGCGSTQAPLAAQSSKRVVFLPVEFVGKRRNQ